MKTQNKHIGSNFDALLKEEGVFDEVDAVAIKKAIVLQIEEARKRIKLTKSMMARRMHTSRTTIERLFDPQNASVTLLTLSKAASALGKKLKIQLV
jgi:DNA-binding transcriptional regulator YiaG